MCKEQKGTVYIENNTPTQVCGLLLWALIEVQIEGRAKIIISCNWQHTTELIVLYLFENIHSTENIHLIVSIYNAKLFNDIIISFCYDIGRKYTGIP